MQIGNQQNSYGCASSRERYEEIIPREGKMRKEFSRNIIKIKDKNGKLVWGYNYYHTTEDGQRLHKFAKTKRLSLDREKAAKLFEIEKKNFRDTIDEIAHKPVIDLIADYVRDLDERHSNQEIGKFHTDTSKRYLNLFKLYLKLEYNRTLLVSEIGRRDVNLFLGIRKGNDNHKGRKRLQLINGNDAKRLARSVVKQLFDYAIDLQYIDRNPIEGVKKFASGKGKAKPLSIDELEDIINTLPSQGFENRTRRNNILLAAYLGARGITIGDVLLDDIKLSDGEYNIFLRRNKDKNKYTFPLTEMARFAYLDQLDNLFAKFGHLDGRLPLFPNAKGKPMLSTTRSHWISDAIHKYFPDDPRFIGKSFKSLRSFTATQVSVHVDLDTARLVLTHKKSKTTEDHYLEEVQNPGYSQRKIGLESIPKIKLQSKRSVPNQEICNEGLKIEEPKQVLEAHSIQLSSNQIIIEKPAVKQDCPKNEFDFEQYLYG